VSEAAAPGEALISVMQNDKRQPVLLALAATSLLLSPTHAALVLRGAGRLSSAPFGGDCKEDKDCASVHCFDGKCAYSGKCKKRGAACHTFAAHTCCTGVCQAVAMVDDCKRLLTLNGKKTLAQGMSVSRQCQFLGVCQHFPGVSVGPGRLSTPWAVPADDWARKYFTRAGITFEEGVAVRTDLYIARRVGQTYLNISPDKMKPGSLSDAGVVIFTDDSKVEVDMGASWTDGTATYCAAPILRDGAGGGYYAVGQGCCDKKGFRCDDVKMQHAGQHVTSGLVVVSDREKYMQAVNLIEGLHGFKFHGDGKGIKTPVPMFVRILKDYAKEHATPSAGFTYVAPVNITQCVAPVMAADKQNKKGIQFWAAGNDCCSLEGGFHCGDVDAAGARSGEQVKDNTGTFQMAVTMAKLRYGLQAPSSPYYVKWTAATLVPTPPGLSR